MFFFISSTALGQDIGNLDKELINIDLHFPQVGDTSILGLVHDNESWLAIEDVFNFLKIKTIVNSNGRTINGFISHADSLYSIQRDVKYIMFKNEQFGITEEDLISYENRLYLRSTLFYLIFKIECRYDARSFSVNLFTKKDLPILIEKKQRQMRLNLGKLKNDIVVDTTYKGQYQLFNLSVADWSINNVINFKGKNETQANFSFGGSVARGETNIAIQYNNKNGFDNRQQYYQWRRIDNDNPLLKQFAIGKINSNAIATLFAPVVGVKISNTPTITRQGFGTYRISKYTEPNWMVELYVNNILINYTKADAAGFYSFDIPVLYGNSQIMIKYYGPNGEQKVGEFNINIPYNFLPKSKLEYVVNAGIVEDSLASKFTKAQLNYGLTNNITIGSGVEYLSSIITRKDIPYLNVNLKLTDHWMFTAQYSQDVKSSFTSNYKLRKNIIIEANFTKYKEGQKAIFNNYLEERNISIAFPWSIKKIRSYSRLNIYQIVLANTMYTTLEGMFSGNIFGGNVNLSNYAILSQGNKTYYYSNISANYLLKKGYILMPMLQFEYNTKKFISSRFQVDKNISKRGYINAFYEHNFKSNISSFNIGIRYDLNYLQAGYNFRTNSASNPAMINYVRGSILYDKHSNYIGFNNRPGIGRSGLVVFSFLDFNNDGIREYDEPKVEGLKFTFAGGAKIWHKKDSSFVIRNLEPYFKYILTIDKNSFDEIAWRLNKTILKVELNPNEFTTIGIPIAVLGEVSGKVTIKNADGEMPLSRIIVEIIDENEKIVVRTLSEEDGYYNYIGLPVGIFKVRINTSQVQNLGYSIIQIPNNFEIKRLIHGDNVPGLDIQVKK